MVQWLLDPTTTTAAAATTIRFPSLFLTPAPRMMVQKAIEDAAAAAPKDTTAPIEDVASEILSHVQERAETEGAAPAAASSPGEAVGDISNEILGNVQKRAKDTTSADGATAAPTEPQPPPSDIDTAGDIQGQEEMPATITGDGGNTI